MTDSPDEPAARRSGVPTATDAPLYLARYAERRSTTAMPSSGRPAVVDPTTPTPRTPRSTCGGSASAGSVRPPPTRSVPLELEGERFTREYAGVTREPRDHRAAGAREAEDYVTEIRIIRHGITQGYSTDAGLTPMGAWQAHQRGQALRAPCGSGRRCGSSAPTPTAPGRPPSRSTAGCSTGWTSTAARPTSARPETIDELKNFQVWTPDGVRDITASFRKYQAEMEKLERMAVGDRPRWLVEIDRFYRTQLGGADPIQQWLTIPLMYFESPQACVRRFWQGFNRLIAESPGPADHRGHPLGPDPRVRDLGARLRPGRAGQHRGGRGPGASRAAGPRRSATATGSPR